VGNIVVGYDGSEHSKRALDHAAALGRQGAKVTVVTAVPVEVHGPRSMGALNESELAAQREVLDAGVAHLKDQGVEARGVEGEGEPADVILEAAREAGANLVVVGTRGLNAAERLLLGSVSTKVVHHAHCDVLVIR